MKDLNKMYFRIRTWSVLRRYRRGESAVSIAVHFKLEKAAIYNIIKKGKNDE